MAKRTRRERRFDIEKQKQFAPKAAPAESPTLEAAPAAELTEEFAPAAMKSPQAVPLPNRKTTLVNFAQEYYYEYSELSHILVITAILFVVMIGLSFFI